MRTCRIVEFAISADYRVKLKESKNRDNYLDLASELKKNMEDEGDDDTNSNSSVPCNLQMVGRRTGGFGNKTRSGEHPSCSVVKLDQSTKKSPQDLRRVAITQTPVENHQLTLVWDILNE